MKDKILHILRAENGFVSGEQISNRLHVSRAAVWKNVNKLRQMGYEIESVTNKGYKLMSSPDILTAEEIKNGLDTKLIGQNVCYYTEVDSTNNAAKRENAMPDGSLFIAEIQTGGRGRRGNTWVSPKGSGIWMSLLLKPDISPENISEVTLIAGLAVCRGVNTILPDTMRSKIKWPNDVVMNGKKICGILTELSAEIDAVNYIVTGIGINVNTPCFGGTLSQKATSLLIETGKTQKRTPLVQAVLQEFEILYTAYLRDGFSAIAAEYKENCVTLGKTVKITKGTDSFTAQALDVGANGQLIVEKDGNKIIVNSGEVSVRGIYGYI